MNIEETTGNYDPNRKFTDRMEVEVTFGAWEYRKTIRSECGGNCRGMDIIRAAVGNIYDQIVVYPHGDDEDGVAIIVLENGHGGTLECEDEEGRGEEWLEEMVLAARIVSLNGHSLQIVEEAITL